ncbi:MAG: hypothetical protein ACJ8AH_11505 [Stellaceae bacterium]|jgi:hypothetical protein
MKPRRVLKSALLPALPSICKINLLVEHEVTKLLALMSAVAAEVEPGSKIDPEVVEELKQDVAPEAVLDEIEGKKKSSGSLPTSG